MREWEWVGAQRPFEQGEGDVPAWYPQYGRVDISTMKSWSEVAQWAVNLYAGDDRSEEHTSELQSLMRISYAVFCLKKKKHKLYFYFTLDYKVMHHIPIQMTT